MLSIGRVEDLPVFHAIELPCLIKNGNKAIQCVGGIDAVKELLNNEPNICFRFPGENPLRTTLNGTVKYKPVILLKAVRKRNKRTNQIVSQSVQAVGRIQKTIIFENPADYQFLPRSNTMNDYVEALNEKRNDIPLEILPQSFARIEFNKRLQVLSFLLNAKKKPTVRLQNASDDDEGEQDKEERETTKKVKATKEDTETNTASNEDSAAVIIRVGDEIPFSHPLGLYPPKWNNYSKDYQGHQLLENIKQILFVIPVISKKLLIELLGLANRVHQFKETLLYAAYTYSSGPFQHLWIRYGYDPTKDPTTRIYQIFSWRSTKKFLADISDRITNALGKDKVLRRMINLDQKILMDPPKEPHIAMIDKGSSARLPLELFGYPVKQQLLIQVCRLSNQETFEFMKKIKPELIFHPVTGWYSAQVLDVFRNFLIEIITKYCEEICVHNKEIKYQASTQTKYDKNFFATNWPSIEDYLLNDDTHQVPLINEFPELSYQLKWLKIYRQYVRDESSIFKDFVGPTESPTAPIYAFLQQPRETLKTTPITNFNEEMNRAKRLEEVKAFQFFQDSDSEED